MGGSHQAYYFSLYCICILVFIHHDILEAMGDLLTHLFIFLQNPFEVDQKVIVIHQTMFNFKILIMILKK